MPISSETTRSEYSGDGATIAFAVGFVYFDTSHVRVIHVDANSVETVWVYGTEYTLSGDGAAGAGQVDVDTTPTDYTPASGERLVIRLFPPLLQETDLPSGNYLDDMERMVDICCQMVLRLQDEMSRSVQLPEGSTTSGIEIPEPEANKVLGWNSGGTALENVTPNTGAFLSVSAFAETLLDDTTAAAMRSTLGISDNLLDTDDIGSSVQAFDADTLKADVSDNLTAGFSSDVEAIGNSGTGTVTLAIEDAKENFKTLTVNGSFTLAPQTVSSVIMVIATNDGTGGYTITTSGYDLVQGTYNNAASAVHLFESVVIGSTQILSITEIA